MEEPGNQNGKIIIIYIFSFLITLINLLVDFILEIVLEKLIKHEKSYTLTNFYATYSINLTFFWFLNSGILPAVTDHSVGEDHEVLTNNMITSFLINSFVKPIMWTINPKFLYKKWQKKKKY